MQADPAYGHPATQSQLADQASAIKNKKAVVDEEIADRQALDTAYQSHDKRAIGKAKAALAATRAAHPKDFGKGASVSLCQPCLDNKLDKIKTVRRPQNVEAMTDQITGTFEGREPDYCAVNDSRSDKGRLSYGKHQASEKSGNLYKMLSQYSKNPNADPATKTKIDKQLDQFSADHRLYNGTAADRSAFMSELKEACQDPAMQSTQDDYFRENFMKPALQRAADRCVSSPLGESMFYDMSIQTGTKGNIRIARDAMKNLGYPTDAKCQPCNPKGPTEADYLQSLNDTRRAYVATIPGDASKSTYREDFFDDMLEDDNLSLQHDFVVKGVPVKGLPPVEPDIVSGATTRLGDLPLGGLP